MPSHFSVRLYLHSFNQTRHLINISFLFLNMYFISITERREKYYENKTGVNLELFCSSFCFDSVSFSLFFCLLDYYGERTCGPGAFRIIYVFFPRELINKLKSVWMYVCAACWLHTAGHEVCFNCVDVAPLLLKKKGKQIELNAKGDTSPSDPPNTWKIYICILGLDGISESEREPSLRFRFRFRFLARAVT